MLQSQPSSITLNGPVYLLRAPGADARDALAQAEDKGWQQLLAKVIDQSIKEQQWIDIPNHKGLQGIGFDGVNADHIAMGLFDIRQSIENNDRDCLRNHHQSPETGAALQFLKNHPTLIGLYQKGNYEAAQALSFLS